MVLSDSYLRDASSNAQSHRGRIDSAFEAGYAALLSVLTPTERNVPEHPHSGAASLAAKRLGVDGSQAAYMVRTRYSVDQGPDLAEAMAWAACVRARVQGLELV